MSINQKIIYSSIVFFAFSFGTFVGASFGIAQISAILCIFSFVLFGVIGLYFILEDKF